MLHEGAQVHGVVWCCWAAGQPGQTPHSSYVLLPGVPWVGWGVVGLPLQQLLLFAQMRMLHEVAVVAEVEMAVVVVVVECWCVVVVSVGRAETEDLAAIHVAGLGAKAGQTSAWSAAWRASRHELDHEQQASESAIVHSDPVRRE